MKSIAIALTAVIFAGGIGAAAAASIQGSRDIKNYQNAAGSEVAQMPAGSMVNWQALDDRSLAVWTANDKPWLVRTDEACGSMLHGSGLQMTSTKGIIKSGTDYVEVGSTRCKIASIQPVDYSRLMAQEHHHKMSHHASRRTHKAAKTPAPVEKPVKQDPGT